MSIRDELETIRVSNGGLITPETIVNFAENPATELHSHFEWDDTAAAHKYRLVQAQQILRVQVLQVGPEKTEVRAYISLTSDRGKGEYRHIVDVMKSKTYRDQLLEDARGELRAFKVKYEILLDTDLAAIKNAIKELGI